MGAPTLPSEPPAMGSECSRTRARVPIEAVYVFPASTRAAVHGMRMKIGSRVIEAKIDRRQAARDSYEAARREGKRASLLEQERPNVFTMNVANIMPGDRIEVELDYSELLVPDEAIYEFVYPTVVGPRYAGGADPGKDKWMANPHLPAGTPAPYALRHPASTSRPASRSRSSRRRRTRSAVNYAGADARRRDARRSRAAATATSCCATGWRATRSRPACCCEAEGAASAESFFALMMEPPRRPTPRADPAARVHLRARRLGLDARLPARHGQDADARPARPAAPDRPLQRRAVLGRRARAEPARLAARDARTNVAAGDRRHRAAARAAAAPSCWAALRARYAIPAREPGDVAHVVVVTDGYVGVEAQAFRLHPRAPRRGQPVRVRHRQQRQPRTSSRAWRAPGRASRSSCCVPRRRRPRPTSCARTSSRRC